MLKLLLGVLIEIFVGVLLAGLILALAIPLLSRNDLAGASDTTARAVIVSVLAGVVAIALFRPGSAIQRYLKR
jgi:hypothetical protein